MKKEMKEVVGVPKGITNTGEKLYNALVYELKSLLDSDITEYEFYISPTEPYKIADMEISEINFEVNLFPNEELKSPEIMGMATGGGHELKISKTQKPQLVRLSEDGVCNIKSDIAVPENWTPEMVLEMFKKQRLTLIGVITHELKHEYDSFKNPNSSLESVVDYQSAKQLIGGIPPLSKFAFFLYFIHQVENLVRPSELAAMIDVGKISKKHFLMFLMNNKTYTTLDIISNLTLDKLKTALKNYVGEIKEIFEANDFDYEGMSEDEIIDEMLQVFFMTMMKYKIDIYSNSTMRDVALITVGFSEYEMDDLRHEEFLNKLRKYKDNYKNYFDSEIKRMNREALKLKKKLAKLYSIAKDA